MARSDCMIDSMSICSSIDAGLTGVIEELIKIHKEMEKQTELLSELSTNIEEMNCAS